jgi:hypothetical protein
VIACTTTPSPEELALWAQGSRTVKQAVAQSGLSRNDLFALMKDGTVRFRIKNLNGTRIVLWCDVVRYVASLPTTPPKRHVPKRAARSACARTA